MSAGAGLACSARVWSGTGLTGQGWLLDRDIHRTSQIISSSLLSLLQLSFHGLHHVKKGFFNTPVPPSPAPHRVQRDSHSTGGASWCHGWILVLC